MADRVGGAAPPEDGKATEAPLVRLRDNDRRPMLGAIVAVAILVLAVLKPWGATGDASRPVQPDEPVATPPSVAVVAPGPPTVPSPTPPGYDAPGGQCYPSTDWRLFAVEMNTGHRLRTWLSIEPGSARNALDPAVPFVRVVTDSLLALGFCVGSGPDAPGSVPEARAWALAPGGAARPVALAPLPEYMPRPANLGAVYRPPGSTGEAPATGWSPGRYVFAVRQGPAATDEHWFGVDLVVALSAAPPAP